MQWNLILVHVLSSWLYKSLHISSLKAETVSFVLCYNQARGCPGEVVVGGVTPGRYVQGHGPSFV